MGQVLAEEWIQSEVSGTVWKIKKTVADVVEEDDVILILESMKMEIPVEAPCAGTVASVLVAPEDTVEEDQDLLVISA